MDLEEKALAERVLNHICVGRSICGLHWYGGGPNLLIDYYNRPNLETYLRIESYWHVDIAPHDSEFLSFPINIDYLTFLQDNLEKLASDLCKLRGIPISEVSLAERIPHLALHFENGQYLVINGHSEQYESWEISVVDQPFSVIALPGDGISVETPASF